MCTLSDEHACSHLHTFRRAWVIITLKHWHTFRRAHNTHVYKHISRVHLGKVSTFPWKNKGHSLPFISSGKSIELVFWSAQISAVWSSGMILVLGTRGPGFNSRNGPSSLFELSSYSFMLPKWFTWRLWNILPSFTCCFVLYDPQAVFQIEQINGSIPSVCDRQSSQTRSLRLLGSEISLIIFCIDKWYSRTLTWHVYATTQFGFLLDGQQHTSQVIGKSVVCPQVGADRRMILSQ